MSVKGQSQTSTPATQKSSILRFEPRHDFRPYMSLCLASDQNAKMLQADAEFTRTWTSDFGRD
jgi:hypothetical protein